MIRFSNVSKTYDNGTEALKNVDLEIADGEFVFIVGARRRQEYINQTLLREEVPSSGTIEVNGYTVNRLKRRQIPGFRRSLGVVFQDFRLIPTMNVYDNVAFALRVTNVSARDIRRRVPYILSLVGLAPKSAVQNE